MNDSKENLSSSFICIIHGTDWHSHEGIIITEAKTINNSFIHTVDNSFTVVCHLAGVFSRSTLGTQTCTSMK